MATYYNGPRVRLPSNRSLQLSDVSSSSPRTPLSPHPHSPASGAPVLIFPAPSSEPASPHPHLRSRSLAHGPLRLRPTRVDSNASSLARVDSAESSSRARVDSNASSSAVSLLASPSVTDLSTRFSLVNSPRLVRSATASEWDDLGAGSGSGSGSGPGTTLGLSPVGSSSPLTRDRIVRLGSARMIPSSWRSGSGGSGSLEVEMWEWTSTGSEVDGAREGWREDRNETNYEDALSQFHFPTLEESRWACERWNGVGAGVGAGVGVGGAPEATRPRAVSVAASGRPTHPALGQRVVRLPFRFLLETVLGISPATLMLLERGSHEPEFISETGLFGAATEGVDAEIDEAESSVERRVLLDLGEGSPMRMVKRGLDALADPVVLVPLPLKVSICLVASIPRRVWAGLGIPGMPKWRVGG